MSKVIGSRQVEAKPQPIGEKGEVFTLGPNGGKTTTIRYDCLPGEAEQGGYASRAVTPEGARRSASSRGGDRENPETHPYLTETKPDYYARLAGSAGGNGQRIGSLRNWSGWKADRRQGKNLPRHAATARSGPGADGNPGPLALMN